MGLWVSPPQSNRYVKNSNSIRNPPKPSAYFMYQQMQSLRSAHTVHSCFARISEQTANIFSLYSIYWLLFITKTVCVYRAVQIGYLSTMLFDFGELWSRAMTQTVSAPGSNPVQYMWNLWRIKWHCDRYLSEHSGFPHLISCHQCYTLIFIYTLLLPWQTCKLQRALGNCEKCIEKYAHDSPSHGLMTSVLQKTHTERSDGKSVFLSWTCDRKTRNRQMEDTSPYFTLWPNIQPLYSAIICLFLPSR
jgi:hypothetical protein